MNVEKRESGDEEILVARLDSRSKQLVASFSSFFFFLYFRAESFVATLRTDFAPSLSLSLSLSF